MTIEKSGAASVGMRHTVGLIAPAADRKFIWIGDITCRRSFGCRTDFERGSDIAFFRDITVEVFQSGYRTTLFILEYSGPAPNVLFTIAGSQRDLVA